MGTSIEDRLDLFRRHVPATHLFACFLFLNPRLKRLVCVVGPDRASHNLTVTDVDPKSLGRICGDLLAPSRVSFCLVRLGRAAVGGPASMIFGQILQRFLALLGSAVLFFRPLCR